MYNTVNNSSWSNSDDPLPRTLQPKVQALANTMSTSMIMRQHQSHRLDLQKTLSNAAYAFTVTATFIVGR